MSHQEDYKGYVIKSNPQKLAETENFNFSVNGIIQIDQGNTVQEILIQKLNKIIPPDEWEHDTEEAADRTFIEYAKKYIDNNLQQ